MSFRDTGWGGGRQKLDCLENSDNERFILLLLGNKSLIFEFFETKGGGEGGSFSVVSKRQNMSDFYFASIPYAIIDFTIGNRTQTFTFFKWRPFKSVWPLILDKSRFSFGRWSIFTRTFRAGLFRMKYDDFVVTQWHGCYNHHL